MGKVTGGSTVPRIFIGGKFVGGCDEVKFSIFFFNFSKKERNNNIFFFRSPNYILQENYVKCWVPLGHADDCLNKNGLDLISKCLA